MKKLVTTLCIIHQHPRVLLGMKKRRFGEGRWNGYGGKVEAGESLEESLFREMKEEAGVSVENLTQVGVIDFILQESGEIIEVNIFKTDKFSGDIVETEEMKPQWFHIDEIPFRNMWPTDMYWMPFLLKNKKFKGRVTLDRPSSSTYTSVVLDKNIIEVENL